MMKKPKSDYSIQTVNNAFRLLEAFQHEEELGVTELSRILELHKNNVFRLLATLEQRGYIEQSADSDRYRLGSRCLELGQYYAHSHTLLRRARPVLAELCRATGESTHLGVLWNFAVVHVDGEVPSRGVLAGSRVGETHPAHCTAIGKVLLGCAGESLREEYDREVVSKHGLVKRTPATISDSHKLFEHLRTVAVQGYALDLEEFEPDLCCAAAPVHGAAGAVVGALSVTGPTFRLDEDDLRRRIVPLVCGAAESLSRDLGYAS